MYELLRIDNFRGLRNLEIKGMKGVNLIAGVNNIGKTAFLEAMFLHAGGFNPMMIFQIETLRGYDPRPAETAWRSRSPWQSIFTDFDTQNVIRLSGYDSRNKSRTVEIQSIENPQRMSRILRSLQVDGTQATLDMNGDEAEPSRKSSLPFIPQQILELKRTKRGAKAQRFYLIPERNQFRVEPLPPAADIYAYYQTPRTEQTSKNLAERFGELQINGRDYLLLEALQLIEPRLKRLVMVVLGGRPVIHGDLGFKHLVPLPIMGAGMARLASLIIGICSSDNGVVLVDEIEVGLHHSVMKDVWNHLSTIAKKFNTQIVATTHSRECITSAHKAFEDSTDYDFQLYRLERIKEKIQTVTYDRTSLEMAITSGWEVR